MTTITHRRSCLTRSLHRRKGWGHRRGRSHSTFDARDFVPVGRCCNVLLGLKALVVLILISGAAAAQTTAVPSPTGENSSIEFDVGMAETIPPVVQEEDVVAFSQTLRNDRATIRNSFFVITPHEYGPTGYVRRPHDAGSDRPFYIAEQSPLRASRTSIPHGSSGKKTLIRWGGRVHLDAPFDFDAIGSTAEFVTATIPVPQERGSNVDFSARSSRLDLRTQTDSSVGPITGFAQIDFFDKDTQGPSGSFRPRLRFFYFDIGHLRFGQDASVFMDYGAYPNIIENEGPASMVLLRQSLVRLTLPVSKRWNLAFGFELDKDTVRRILAVHYKPDPRDRGPS